MDNHRWTKGKSEHKFIYTFSHLASITNLQVSSLYKYVQRGQLDMNDLVSVAKFIMKHMS